MKMKTIAVLAGIVGLVGGVTAVGLAVAKKRAAKSNDGEGSCCSDYEDCGQRCCDYADSCCDYTDFDDDSGEIDDEDWFENLCGSDGPKNGLSKNGLFFNGAYIPQPSNSTDTEHLQGALNKPGLGMKQVARDEFLKSLAKHPDAIIVDPEQYMEPEAEADAGAGV